MSSDGLGVIVQKDRLMDLVRARPDLAPRGFTEDVLGYAFFARMLQLLEPASIDLAVDLRAGEGHFGRVMRDFLRWRGVLYSYETVSPSLEVLQRHAATDPGWAVIEATPADRPVSAVLDAERPDAVGILLKLDLDGRECESVGSLGAWRERTPLVLGEWTGNGDGPPLHAGLAAMESMGYSAVDALGHGGCSGALFADFTLLFCREDERPRLQSILRDAA